MATIRARPTGKTKRKRIKAFLALCAAPSVRDQGAVLDQCFPCRAYCACLALRFVIFFWVCFTQLARNAMNGCPVFHWCTTWHRNLWSHGTVRTIYAFVFFLSCAIPVYLFWFARKVSSDTADLYEIIRKNIYMWINLLQLSFLK